MSYFRIFFFCSVLLFCKDGQFNGQLDLSKCSSVTQALGLTEEDDSNPVCDKEKRHYQILPNRLASLSGTVIKQWSTTDNARLLCAQISLQHLLLLLKKHLENNTGNDTYPPTLNWLFRYDAKTKTSICISSRKSGYNHLGLCVDVKCCLMMPSNGSPLVLLRSNFLSKKRKF